MLSLRAGLLLFILSLSSLAFAQKGGGSSSGSKKFGIRVQYGFLDGNTKDFDTQIQGILNTEVPDLKPAGYGSLDLLFTPDSMVYGLRYDFFRSTASSNYSNRPLEADLSGTRLVGLLGWRVLRIQQGYLGLISHFDLGLSTVKYEATTTSSQGVKQTYDYKGKAVPGYGIALEGAYYAEGKFPTGLEIGYTHYGASSFEDANGAAVRDSTGADLKIDLSGLYARVFVGFVF